MGIVLHTLAALGYALLAARPWYALLHTGTVGTHAYERYALPLVLILHGAGLYFSMHGSHGLYLGLGLAISSTLWLGMLVYWVESLVVEVSILRLLLLPVAAVAAFVPVVLPDRVLVAHASNPWMIAHLVVSLAAYGIMTVAALHALLTAATDSHLHRPQESTQGNGVWRELIERMPPLLTLEHLLFRLIWIGFILLSLAVVSGSGISLSLGGSIFPFDHKTIFTLLAWLSFGLLLVGRRLRGWRGRVAVRYTLAGLVLLLLAYIGTRFVIEFILKR